jgi:acyl-coenzyme A thioesterase PaaI-like protein
LHRNLSGNAHGGFLLALVDHALFVGPALLGIEGAVGGVTMDVSAQFLAPAVVDARVEAAVEVLRETHRTLFVRGTLEQSGEPVVAFSGMVRKASARS